MRMLREVLRRLGGVIAGVVPGKQMKRVEVVEGPKDKVEPLADEEQEPDA